MNQEHAALLRAEMEAMGYVPDANGRFTVMPGRVILTPEQWAELTRTGAMPGEELDAMLPALRDAWLEELEARLERRPNVEKLRKKGVAPNTAEFIEDAVQVDFTREDCLNAPVRLNLGLNVDDFSDYTMNVTYPAYLGEEYDLDNAGHFGRSSIMWLTRRQGYSQAELREAQYNVKRAASSVDPHSIIRSHYLYSAAMEIWHEMSIFNQLGFFVRVPLREALLMKAMTHWAGRHKKWPGYVLLDTSVRCGFFSTWNGSCSLLGIELEKPVKLPLCDVDISPDMDSGGGEYGGYSLYGVVRNDGLWKEGCILHWGLPRQFRRDAAALGFDALPPRGPFRI